MNTSLKDIVKQFSNIPFLFVGSGLTRRYYNLPDWKGLLEAFVKRVTPDEYAFNKYKMLAMRDCEEKNIYPKIATLLEKDFNDKWFADKDFRKTNDEFSKIIKEDVSPFKVEIAQFIQNKSILNNDYAKEFDLFKNICLNHISGFITTNYDCFLETIAPEYKCYIGQKDLIFSPTQGIAEIYKIHGSVNEPESIVITEKDYAIFNEKSAYLAAKLMTIFLEYPIIFIGYSIQDQNIQNILNSIVLCLSETEVLNLKNRFIFIERAKKPDTIEISGHTMAFGSKAVEMTKIKLYDFGLLYEAITEKKAALPVKMLRMFKEEFYNFAIKNIPSAKIRVAQLDNPLIKDEDLMLAIGNIADFGVKGITGFEPNEWYRNVIMADSPYSADDILEYAYPKLNKSNAKLPVYKYLAEARREHTECNQSALHISFDSLLSQSIRKQKERIKSETNTVNDTIRNNDFDLNKKLIQLSYLKKEELLKGLDDLEQFLINLFSKQQDILKNGEKQIPTNLRRAIRIFDYLKYKNKEAVVKESI